jgi:hypothetical protein
MSTSDMGFASFVPGGVIRPAFLRLRLSHDRSVVGEGRMPLPGAVSRRGFVGACTARA